MGAPQLPQHLGVETLLFGKVTATLAVTVKPPATAQYRKIKGREYVVPNVLLFFMFGIARGGAAPLASPEVRPPS